MKLKQLCFCDTAKKYKSCRIIYYNAIYYRFKPYIKQHCPINEDYPDEVMGLLTKFLQFSECHLGGIDETTAIRFNGPAILLC